MKGLCPKPGDLIIRNETLTNFWSQTLVFGQNVTEQALEQVFTILLLSNLIGFYV
jgi:hypothetical protein